MLSERTEPTGWVSVLRDTARSLGFSEGFRTHFIIDVSALRCRITIGVKSEDKNFESIIFPVNLIQSDMFALLKCRCMLEEQQ